MVDKIKNRIKTLEDRLEYSRKDGIPNYSMHSSLLAEEIVFLRSLLEDGDKTYVD